MNDPPDPPLEVFRKFFPNHRQLFASFVNFWQLLVTLRNFSQVLAFFGNFCHVLPTFQRKVVASFVTLPFFGNPLQLLEILGNLWPLMLPCHHVTSTH